MGLLWGINADPCARRTNPSVMRGLPHGIRPWLVPASVSAILTVLVAVAANPILVSGTSMEPLLDPGDRLLVSRFVTLARGDIVVLDVPHISGYLVKRIVALPGERIRIIDATVYVNGRALYEPYVHGPWTSDIGYNGGLEVTIAPDHYFLLGDNRDVSLDSRSLGPQRRTAIIGLAWARAWPRPVPLAHYPL